MKSTFSTRFIVHLALALALIAIVPFCQAKTAAGAAPGLDKHARKIHKRIAKYPSGTYVNVVLRDGSQSAGLLGPVSPASFTITNADTNAPETHDYADVATLQKGREYIGAGSESEHHVHWIRWSIVGVAAAGAAVTAFEVR
ncbi:MAG: hypothetical protein WBE38_04235 [Terracidiphilus sp.]|jgi:hypothetical protein